MTVGLLGDTTVLAGAGSALTAIGVEHRRVGVAELETVDSAILAAPCTEHDRFKATAERFADDGSSDAAADWVAVELGGLGGQRAAVAAAVTGFGDATGCYDCLRWRRQSTLDSGESANTSASDSPDDPQMEPADAHLAGVVAARMLDEEAPGSADDAPATMARTVELPWRERPWLPVPTCSRCGGRPDRTLSLSVADEPLAESLARAEHALEERLGLLTAVGERESYPAPYYVAETADTTVFSDADAADFAAGVAADWNPAFMKALGEGLERYCAGVYRDEWFTTATATAIGEGTGATVVRPGAFATGAGGESTPSTEDAERLWVAGRSLAAAEPVVLPASRVQFPAPRDAAGITTGLALGSGTVPALRGGLCEVIERDATMCTWYSTIEPVGLECADEDVLALTRRARGEDLAVSLSLSTVDVDVPVVTAAVHREDPWPRFAVGSGAALDPDAAARSALGEAIQNWMELRAMGRERAGEEEPTLVTYADDPALADDFLDPDTTVHARDLTDGVVPRGREALETLVERVSDAGLSPYAARITTEDVAALGFEAVRVLVPAAQPLFVGDPVFGERARSVPEAFGEEPRLDRQHHPYP